MKNTLTSH